MSVEGLQPITIDTFGSWVTIQDAYKEANVSPDCQDVEFYPGGVRTRPGVLPSAPGVDSPVNSAAGFSPQQPQVGPQLARRLVVLTADGRVLKTNAGAFVPVAQLLAAAGQMKTVSAFGRLWMGFSDGTQGSEMPRQFDDANFDRVSLEGPGAGPAGTADAVAAGSIVAGVHQVATFFITRNGYKTRLSPPVAWTAAGAKKVTVPLPIGPAGIVVGRGVAITTAGGASFYYMVDRMTVMDNVTATVTIDFTDGALSGGLPVDYLRALEILPDCTMPLSYASRMFWIGEQPMMQFWANLMFDGGFAGGFPLGWTAGGSSAGGSEDVTAPFGSAYRITGDGATDTRGLITQAATLDPFQGAPLIQANTPYTIRARVKKGGGLVAGTLNIDLFGTGIDTAGLQLTAFEATAAFVEYTAQLTVAIPVVPADLVLRVFANGVPTNGGYFVLDDLRIFPAVSARPSRARGSRAFDPESYIGPGNDGNGTIQVSPDDGQDLRSHFFLRDFYYLVKERSMWVTQDDGVNEPGNWQLKAVSEEIGTPSMNGVAKLEGFALIINERGCYKYMGGLRLTDENKVSNEIQPDWDKVNWAGAGQNAWIIGDSKRMRAYMGLPVGPGQLTCNQVWTLDWSGGWDDPIRNNGAGRQWAPWLPMAGAASLCGVLAPDPFSGILTPFFGASDGVLYQLGKSVAAQPQDGAATAIHSKYQTSYVTRPEMSRRGQASWGVNELGYITGPVYGAGAVSISALQDSQGGPVLLGKWTQELALTKDLEMMVDVQSERIAVLVETNAAGSYFDMSLLTLHAQQSPWSPVRGT